jgi:hypothetical protein
MSAEGRQQTRRRKESRFREQLALLCSAAVLVAALVPVVWNAAERAAPYVELIAGGSGRASGGAGGGAAGGIGLGLGVPGEGRGNGTRGNAGGGLPGSAGGAPRAASNGAPGEASAFPFVPETAFDDSLGAAYERVTELPPTLRYIERATERFAGAETALTLNGGTPRTLHRGITYRAELSLRLEESAAALKRELATDAQGRRHLSRIRTVLEAELEAPGVAISPADPIRRAVDADRELTWSWTVEPRLLGRQEVTARLTPLFVVSGVEYAESMPTVSVTVEVTPSPWEPYREFYDRTGKWLLAGVALALAAGIIARSARRYAGGGRR